MCQSENPTYSAGNCGCSCGCSSHGHGNDEKNAILFVAPLLSFVMLVAGILMTHFNVGWFEDNSLAELLWYVVAFLPVGLPVMKEAWEGIMEKDVFSEFTLMTVACIGAFCIGEYPEGVGVMLFYSVGEMLQDRAVAKARKNISRLLDVRGEKAHVVTDGNITDTDPKEVTVGTTIEVRPGERVPLDCVLDSDTGVFDTSALTGESIPREIDRGGEVLAGMIASGLTVRMTVSREYTKSALARILELVEDASARKAGTELFIRKFARVYTPVVMAMALLLVLIPWIVEFAYPSFHYVFSEWLYRALVFLVISCPCALVISVPLGYFAGIGAASRLGILFKGSNFLDAVTKVNTVAFDKTGTLTTGNFEVVKVECLDKKATLTFLTLMAAAESNSSHPLAKALVEFVETKGLEIPTPDKMEELPGFGIKAIISGKTVVAGNLKWLKRAGVEFPDNIENGTFIACAVDGKFAGYVLLADSIKPDSAKAVEELRKLGVDRIVMLSGDKKEIVEENAGKLGITESHGELLPQEKAEWVEKITHDPERKIAFVGDGMNDAPVLALSNVGIAMGALGSDAAIESADVVIQTDSPSAVATAIRIGRSTHAIVMENIVGAIAIKVAILILGAFGIASLWAAVFADVGVALLAVLNSVRILYKKY